MLEKNSISQHEHTLVTSETRSSSSFHLKPATRLLVISVYVLTTIMLAITQAFLGSNLTVLLSVFSICLLTVVPLSFSQWVAADLLWIVFSAYGGFLVLAVKTWVGQPLQQNLVDPDNSALFLLLNYACCFVGYLCARTIVNFRSGLLNITELTSNPTILRRFATIFFIIGLAAQFAHNILRPRFAAGAAEQTEGFGGFGALAVFWLAGLAFEVTLWRQHKGSFVRIAMMLASLLLLAIFSNIKKPVFDGLFLIAVGIVLLRGPAIRASVIFTSAFLSLFVMIYLAPLIQIMRPQLVTYAPGEVFEVAADSLVEAAFSPFRLSQRADEISQGYTYSFRENANYLYPSTINADRFALIMPLDQIIRTLPSKGVLGMKSLNDVAETYLPGFLYKKSGVSSVDVIAWHYRMRKYGSVSRPVIGLPGSAVALAGPYLGALVSGIAVFIFYSSINLLAGPLGRSAWSLFVLAAFIQKAAEREISALINTGAREIPMVIFIASIIAVSSAFYRGKQKKGAQRNMKGYTKLSHEDD